MKARHAAGPRPDRLPRARPRPVLGDVEHVHRQGLRALRAEEHRRRRRLGRAVATRSSRPSTSSRRAPTSSCWPTSRCCQQSPRTVAVAAGLVERQGGAHRDDRADRRLDRLALGAADRQLRARGRGRARRTSSAVSPRGCWIVGGGGVPPRRRRSPGSSSGRCTSASADMLGSFLDRLPFVHVDSQLSPARGVDPVGHPAAAGRARRARRRDARARGRLVPGRVPQPAGRSVPARRRGRRRARRDDRGRLSRRHATGSRRRRSSAARSPSSPRTRSAAPPAAAPAARPSSSRE